MDNGISRQDRLRDLLGKLQSNNPGRESEFGLWLVPDDGGWIEYAPPGAYVYTIYSTAACCDGVVFCGDHGAYPRKDKADGKPRCAMLDEAAQTAAVLA